MKKEIIIIGSGGHAKVIVNVLQKIGWKILGYFDKQTNDVFPYKYLGNDDDAINFLDFCKNVVIGVGSTRSFDLRDKIIKHYKSLNFTFPKIISDDAVIADDVLIGEGTVVMDGVIVQPGTMIEKFCVINTRVAIDHDCFIKSGSYISPGTVLCSCVKIGESVFVGAGATIIQSIEINDEVIIGAGAVVITDCEKRGTYVGVPAKRLE